MSRRGVWQVLVAIDQLANALLFGLADETISSRCWKARLRGAWWGVAAVAVIDAAFLYIDGWHHCERSAEWDEP